MFKRNFRKVVGSSRGGRFREPDRRRGRRGTDRRQSIRFRRRYVEAVAKNWGAAVLNTAKVAFVLVVGTWCIAMGIHFFRQADIFKVNEIRFEGDVPANLPAFLPLKAGQNIFFVKSGYWEKEATGKFQEIKNITIRRLPTRNISIHVELREPRALTMDRGQNAGVDETGEIFPLGTSGKELPQNLPLIQASSVDSRRKMVAMLSLWQKEAPEFYSQIEQMEMATRTVLLVKIRGGIQVNWGTIDEKTLVAKAKNILRLLDQYTPTRAAANLEFVTDDRIVMDSNWKKSVPN